MTVAFTVAIPVVQIVQSFVFEMYKDGQRGIRNYVDASVRPDATSENLPAIGSGWDDDYPDCRLRNIRVTYIDDNDNCGRKFECTYDTQDLDDAQDQTNEGGIPVTNDVNKLASTIDAGAEMVTWEPYDKSADVEAVNPLWVPTHFWGSDSEDVKQLVFKRVVTASFSVERIISDAKMDDFLELSFSLQGKLNNSSFFGQPAGTCLYQGCQLQSYLSQFGISNKKKWKGMLTFVYKSVTGTTGAGNDGWNFILREENGEWDKPVMNHPPAGSDGFLYEDGDFDELMTISGPDVHLPNLNVSK